MGPRVSDVTFFNHGGRLGPHVSDVTFFNHGGWVFMVFHGSKLVVHASGSVFMVFMVPG